jgi:hypothetical protein
MMPIPGLPPSPIYYRRDPMAVWQFYGRNRMGQLRPLVIYNSSSAFYLYNGHPYPWPNVRPEEQYPPLRERTTR